jgi:hypothetical protein
LAKGLRESGDPSGPDSAASVWHHTIYALGRISAWDFSSMPHPSIQVGLQV